MRAELQIHLKAMPSAAEVAGTESLDNGLAVEALIFPAYPIGKHHVQVVHDLDKFCLAELVIGRFYKLALMGFYSIFEQISL